MKARKRGFTLCELVIVIAVIAILAAVTIPVFTEQINKAEKSAFMQEAAIRYKEMLLETMDHRDCYFSKKSKYIVFDRGGSEYLGKRKGDNFERGEDYVFRDGSIENGSKIYYDIDDILKGLIEDKPSEGEDPITPVKKFSLRLNFGALAAGGVVTEEAVVEKESAAELLSAADALLPALPSDASYYYVWYEDAACTRPLGEPVDGSVIYAGFATREEYFTVSAAGVLTEVKAPGDILVVPSVCGGRAIGSLDPGLFQSAAAQYYKYIRILADIGEMPASLFKNNLLLADFVIPKTVSTVGNLTFAGCVGLKAIYLPQNLSTLGAYAFKDCRGLKISVEASAAPSGWDKNWNKSMGAGCDTIFSAGVLG